MSHPFTGFYDGNMVNEWTSPVFRARGGKCERRLMGAAAQAMPVCIVEDPE